MIRAHPCAEAASTTSRWPTVASITSTNRTAVRPTQISSPAGAFAAQFAEVRVDPDLGLVRVARVVSAIDGGRILNEKTATSQVIGGTVGGIGMALLEETVTDPASGRITNANLGDYLVPVNAAVPDLEVLFVGEPDRLNPIGVKGVGEVGLVGIAAAIANAVFHATGRRTLPADHRRPASISTKARAASTEILLTRVSPGNA
jgi:CO/xanthine dehydrogenase Mo-binding subunit